jgi:twitching motility protein PilT
VRRFGKLVPVTEAKLSAADVRRIAESALPADDLASFKQSGDMELAYSIQGGGRYRVTLVKQRFGWEMTARVVPMQVRPFEQSGLPDSCRGLTKWAQGLVLVTGPLGCGKTSTLTTLVEMINQERDDHIITVEKPVEFAFKPARCQITQREIGLHTLSQGNALRAALREDPDIMIISELRDLDSISLAISAAETGHLVLATMNTANAQRTISRLVDAFPPDEQEVIRGMISETLRGVISQQLVPRQDGQGLVPAYEVLLVNKAISNLIRKNNLHQLSSAMVTGRAAGMALLDESLKALVQQRIISGEEAFYRATLPKTFKEHAPAALKMLTNE